MAHELVEQVGAMYAKYGRYINKFRSFPLIHDGLKLVERRILLSLSIEAKNSFTKSARICGHCIGHLHPHGDCLRGDTKIPLVDGSNPTIQWLAENKANETFLVFSCDENTGNIVVGKAHSPRIGQTTDIVYKITLDNGESVYCTSNHPFMTRWMRDKRYINADKLKVGMSLRPFISRNYHYKGQKPYRIVRSTYSTYKAVHELVGETFYGLRSENEVYHHKDFNSLNNDPSNIVKITRKEHADIHYKNDPEFNQKANSGLVKGRFEMFSDNGKFRQKIFVKNSNLITEVNHNLQLIKAIRLVQWIAQTQKNISIETYNSFRPTFGYNYPHISTLIKQHYIKDFEDLKKKAEVNHVVTNIEIIKLDKPINFYDITVDTYNNFAIEQGIFVHNSSAYGTLVLLANNGMVDKQGNFGINVGIHDEPAAAARYTEVKMNKEVYDEAFELLKYVKEEDLEMNPEPIYLPTSLPFCLRMKYYCQGIGMGYRTYIPSYTKEDLIKRLDWLLHKQGSEPIIRPITDCTYGSTDAEFKQLLETGKASIIYKGKLELDKVNKCVYVKSIPPNKKFKSVINAFKDEIQVQKSVGFLDESTTTTKVKFLLTKRGQNLDKLYKKLQQKTTGSVTFECNMCDLEGNVVLMSVDKMLLTTYETYKSVNETMLKDLISKLEIEIDELINMQKIKVVLPDLIKQYPDDLDKLVEGIVEKTQIDIEIVKKILDKYTIPKFMKAKIDIEGKKSELNNQKNNLQNIDNYVWNKYQ